VKKVLLMEKVNVMWTNGLELVPVSIKMMEKKQILLFLLELTSCVLYTHQVDIINSVLGNLQINLVYNCITF